MIKGLCENCGIENVVDIGCGKCYLSTHLAYNHDMQVLAIDRDPVQIKGATHRMKNLDKLKKRDPPGFRERIQLVEAEVNDAYFQKRFGEGAEGASPWCMTSLHACGPLSVSMIKSFVSLDSCRLLVNLGCCYHLLDKELIHRKGMHYDRGYSMDTEGLAFPISKMVRLHKAQVSYSLRNLAVQVPHRWNDDDFDPLQGFKRNLNRSIFQVRVMGFCKMLKLCSGSSLSTNCMTEKLTSYWARLPIPDTPTIEWEFPRRSASPRKKSIGCMNVSARTSFCCTCALHFGSFWALSLRA